MLLVLDSAGRAIGWQCAPNNGQLRSMQRSDDVTPAAIVKQCHRKKKILIPGWGVGVSGWNPEEFINLNGEPPPPKKEKKAKIFILISPKVTLGSIINRHQTIGLFITPVTWSAQEIVDIFRVYLIASTHCFRLQLPQIYSPVRTAPPLVIWRDKLVPILCHSLRKCTITMSRYLKA